MPTGWRGSAQLSLTMGGVDSASDNCEEGDVTSHNGVVENVIRVVYRLTQESDRDSYLYQTCLAVSAC
jgi:hypothetical protein